jgi:Holliday junction resolvasome RuvABC endonuclease subunit
MRKKRSRVKSAPIIIGLDPGFTFAFSVLQGKSKLKHVGYITPYRKVAVDKTLKTTIKEITQLIKTYKPNLVICERFMFRGGGSIYAEVINHVIGALVYVCTKKKIPLRLVMAAHWKQYATKNYGYDNKAKSKKRLMQNKAYRMWPRLQSIHQLDATLMARFAYDKEWFR